jgi:YfiH family protein
MLLHTTPFLRIYFGSAEDALNPAVYLQLPAQVPLLDYDYFASLQKVMHLDYLLFLKQTHSAQGIICTENNLLQIRPFKDEGDFLITNIPLVGLGVMTGDCLPVVLYDKRNHVAAIVHAGWRGSAQGIVLNALAAMQEAYNTHIDNLQIFFGPAAKVCCYQVGPEFVAHFDNYSYAWHAFHKYGDELFFDLTGFNKLQLESVGIKKEAFHGRYSMCTMCDNKFYSNRRQKEQAGRQMTVVSLQ